MTSAFKTWLWSWRPALPYTAETPPARGGPWPAPTPNRRSFRAPQRQSFVPSFRLRHDPSGTPFPAALVRESACRRGEVGRGALSATHSEGWGISRFCQRFRECRGQRAAPTGMPWSMEDVCPSAEGLFFPRTTDVRVGRVAALANGTLVHLSSTHSIDCSCTTAYRLRSPPSKFRHEIFRAPDWPTFRRAKR